MTRPTFGPREPTQPSEPQTLIPGMLYIDHCPPEGYVVAYAVDSNGARCYEVRACLRRTTPELIARWRDDARAIASPPLTLVTRAEPARSASERQSVPRPRRR